MLRMIWLPTQSARNNLEKAKRGICQKRLRLLETVKIVPELQDIFQLIKDFDVVLGTGHLSPEEIFRVVEAAKKQV